MSAELVARATRLEELANVIRQEEAKLKEAVERSLGHALSIGRALTEAKNQVPHGDFYVWLETELQMPSGTARAYLRLAYYEQILPAGLNVREAIAYLRGLPPADGKPTAAYPKEIKAEAMRRVKEGQTLSQVSRDMGMSPSCLVHWRDGLKGDPRSSRAKRIAQKRRAAKLAKREEKREEARRAARLRGGSIAEAYSLMRRLAQELDSAVAAHADDREVRRHLKAALQEVYMCEGHISDALGVDYGSWKR